MLLDTHVCLRFLGFPERLGAATREAIEVSPVLYASAVSVAEVEIKRMTGKLDAPADFTGGLRVSGVRVLPLTAEHARGLADLPRLARHDPFDRLLVAQAAVEGVPLATADLALLALSDARLVDARL